MLYFGSILFNFFIASFNYLFNYLINELINLYYILFHACIGLIENLCMEYFEVL